MSHINQMEIRCRHCGTWFPSPVVFGDDESFDTSTLVENEVRCPHCGRMTGGDRESMRLREEEG
jgi:DNA-directed RNA polymerase subunit RPC12/RpoP